MGRRCATPTLCCADNTRHLYLRLVLCRKDVQTLTDVPNGRVFWPQNAGIQVVPGSSLHTSCTSKAHGGRPAACALCVLRNRVRGPFLMFTGGYHALPPYLVLCHEEGAANCHCAHIHKPHSLRKQSSASQCINPGVLSPPSVTGQGEGVRKCGGGGRVMHRVLLRELMGMCPHSLIPLWPCRLHGPCFARARDVVENCANWRLWVGGGEEVWLPADMFRG